MKLGYCNILLTSLSLSSINTATKSIERAVRFILLIHKAQCVFPFLKALLVFLSQSRAKAKVVIRNYRALNSQASHCSSHLTPCSTRIAPSIPAEVTGFAPPRTRQCFDLSTNMLLSVRNDFHQITTWLETSPPSHLLKILLYQ